MELITLENLMRDPVFRHFYQICRIPHGSGNEQALGRYIVDWARGLGLRAGRDDAGNVFIQKKRPGEGIPTVMLQAHLDMVCVKGAASAHDFARDPIRWVISGDTLSTGGETSLGADDGIGVALAMSMLELDAPHFPNLEVLFTVAEEEDMSGALRFDTGAMEAGQLINLDHTNEHEIMCGSCGGMRADFRLPVERVPVPAGWKLFRLTVSGLVGGHSGEDIHRGRGNANILLARILDKLDGICEFGVCALRGGVMRLAIPTEAEAVICIPPERERSVREGLDEMLPVMRRELSKSGHRLEVRMEACGAGEPAAGGCVAPDRLLSALLLSPDGICQMNESIDGMVDTSDNLGEVYLREDALEIVLEIRSTQDSLRFYVYRKLERLAKLLGATCAFSEEYPGWEYRPASALTALTCDVYREMHGRDPRLLTIHAGLEPGCLIQKKPELDAISIGPNLWDLHSVDESLSISSVRRFYQYLQYILTAIYTRRMRDGA